MSMKKNDLQQLSEMYTGMLQEAIMSYSAGDVKISLTKKPDTGEYVIKWYDIVDGKPKYNEDKTYYTSDRDDSAHTFEKMKADIINGSIHENKDKPNALICRNTESLATHPFVLSVDGKKYPCSSVAQAKNLARIMRLLPSVQV